jgi:hypothetical protein
MKKILVGVLIGILLAPVAAFGATHLVRSHVDREGDCPAKTRTFAGLRYYVLCEDHTHDRADIQGERRLTALEGRLNAMQACVAGIAKARNGAPTQTKAINQLLACIASS